MRSLPNRLRFGTYFRRCQGVSERPEVRMSERKSRVGGRDSRTGQFIPVKETYERPNTTQREHIPLPGRGDTDRGGKDGGGGGKKRR
jgi:hypothetical protein